MGQTNIISAFELISFIAFSTELLPVVLYLILKNKIRDKELRVIFILLIIGFIVEILNVKISAKGATTLYIAYIFTLIESLCLLYFFTQISESKFAKKVLTISGFVYTLLWAILFFLNSNTENFETIFAIEAIGIIALSIYYFYQQLNDPDTLFIYMQPRFWVVIAYLIYTAGTFFFFLYFDSLGLNLQKKYYLINSGFLILRTILLSIGMLLSNKPKKKKFQLT